jgi:hypothetical protein
MYPEASEVRADIGGGGAYLNPLLREEHAIPCEDVNFAEEKEAGAAVWNLINEAGAAAYPKEHDEFRRQVRKWKRKNGRIQKGDDHLCDAGICYFTKYIDIFGLRGIRIAPKGFNTSPRSELDQRASSQSGQPQEMHRVPVVRGLTRG